MIEFIPFVSKNAKDVDQSLWNTALYAWISNLVELLNMDETAFKVEVASNDSLPLFVAQVLNEQIDNSDSVDQQLIKYTFLLYSRLASLDNLENNSLLTADMLCSFVVVFGESNANQVRRMMAQFSKQTYVEKELISTMRSLMDIVHSMPTLLGAPASVQVLDRAYVVIRVLDTLLQSTTLVDTIQTSFDTLDSVLADCYKALVPVLKKTVDAEPATKPYAYLIKKSLVSAFNTFADVHFFNPLGFASSTIDHNKLEKSSSSPDISAIDLMNNKILSYIEESGLERSQSAFVDGPLIMDWEVEYNITSKLDQINKELFSGENEILEFLRLSMEQVRDSNYGTGSWGDSLQVHTMQKSHSTTDTSMENTFKISQVHDLFPDLGDGFIEACLDANGGNAEKVIEQLLEDSLPDAVKGLDRAMERKVLPDVQTTISEFQHLEGEAEAVYLEAERRENHNDDNSESILKSRRNIYDNDEFDIFNRGTLDESKVYAGKKDKSNADALLDDKSFIRDEKKKVLQRVVDMYDDDYDDTYDDINDAGVPASVENEDGDAAVDVVRKRQETSDPGLLYESVLVHTFAKNTEVFKRNATMRRSKERAELKKQTGMSDEQIEGWAIMFARNPRKDRILDKYKLFDDKPVQEPILTKEAAKDNTNTKGETKRSDTKDHAYKTKNKARFANHNRKAQKSKKLAKAGPPPS